MNSRVAPTPIGHGLDRRLAEHALQPLRGVAGDLRIQHDVEVRFAEPGDIRGRRAQRGDDVDVDAKLRSSSRVISIDVVAMAEAKRRRSEQIAARPPPGPRAGRCVPGGGACGPAKARTIW